MKIVSICAALTVGPNEVAFKLDEEPTEYAIGKITSNGFYGSLSIKFEQGCLLVKTKPGEKPLTSETVENFNTKLSALQLEENQKINDHNNMVKRISEMTQLPIGQD